MTFYITAENQRLLWNTISNTAIFMNVFGSQNNQMFSDTALKRELLSRNKLSFKDGENWFRNTIQKIYTANINAQPSQLQHLNKITISYMVNELKILLQETSNPTINNMPVNNNHINNTNTIQTQIITPEKKTDISAFEKRQQEYENMFKRPTPPEINFLENNQTEDKSNVDDRLKKHIEEREAELSKYAPPIFPNAQGQPQSIIQNNISANTSNNTGEITSDPLQFLKPVATSVSNTTKNDELSEIKNMVLELGNQMKQMQEIMLKFLPQNIESISTKDNNTIETNSDMNDNLVNNEETN